MASTPRIFFTNVPTLITTRTVLRTKLYEDPVVAEQFKYFAAESAEVHQVRLFHWTLMANHSHMLVSQDFPGLDRSQRRGIAPFVQDLFAPFHRWLNGHHSLQGHARERPYRSLLRVMPAEALQSFLYVTMNPVWHHAVQQPIEYAASGNQVYLESVPDGVITHVPGLFRRLLELSVDRREHLRHLVGRYGLEASPHEGEVATAAALLVECNDWIDRFGLLEAIPIALWAGEEQARVARKALRAMPEDRSRFHPQRAPRLDGDLRVVIERMPDRPRRSDEELDP